MLISPEKSLKLISEKLTHQKGKKRRIVNTSMISMNHHHKQQEDDIKTPILKKKKKRSSSSSSTSSRFLITVNVLGSSGPLRFFINEEARATGIIGTALKLYAREGRFPALNSNPSNFLLYCVDRVGYDALDGSEIVGSRTGARSFVLCKKHLSDPSMTEGRSGIMLEKKNCSVKSRGGALKSWLHKSLSFKILSAH